MSSLIAPCYSVTARAAKSTSRYLTRMPNPRTGRRLQEGPKTDYLDGITMDLGDWWFNVRKSNTEPMLRLNLEATSVRLRDQKFAELKKHLGEPVHGH